MTNGYVAYTLTRVSSSLCHFPFLRVFVLHWVCAYSENSRECKPVTPVECVSLSFRTQLRVLAFITYILCTNGIDGSCPMNLTQKSYSYLHVFQIRNLFQCVVESLWNMSFKGTRHGDGDVDSVVAKMLQLWQHASALCRHAVWIRIVTSHNAWMDYEYLLPNLNPPMAIYKHNPHHLVKMGPIYRQGFCHYRSRIHCPPRGIIPAIRTISISRNDTKWKKALVSRDKLWMD